MLQQPTLSGFQWFLLNVAGFKITSLPPASPVVAWALSFAVQIVNPALRAASGCGPPIAGTPETSVYVTAVYNLATDLVVQFAQDQPGSGFFARLRKKLNVNSFVSGVISGASDESTSQTMVVQEAAKNFTLDDLQRLKTPWGRAYLALAQAFGPTTWGLS